MNINKKFSGVRLATAVAAGLTIFMSACGPSKIMVSDSFLGEDKMIKELIQPTGQSTDESGALYDYFLRVCDINHETLENTNCQDSVVIENVIPRSL